MATFETAEEIKSAQSESGYITGRVAVYLEDIIERNSDGFTDMLSTMLIGNDLLMDVSYEVVELEDQALIIEVTGDPTTALDGGYYPSEASSSSGYTNEAGEPIMDGAAWRYEQSLDDEAQYDLGRDPYDE